MLTQEDLKRRRRNNPNIPTDKEGNLKLPTNKRLISGTKQREKCCTGKFHCKPHSDRPDEKLGTYTQYNFGAPVVNNDVPVEESE